MSLSSAWAGRPGGARGRVAEAPGQRVLRIGFGTLWAVDTLLQLQPVMFRAPLAVRAMREAAVGQPGWLAHTVRWAADLAAPHAGLAHLGIAAVQALIAVLLLGGGFRAVRAGTLLALAWSLAAWLFGEGLGGVLAPAASLAKGAPGCVALYGLAAVLLLLPGDRGADPAATRRLPTAALAAGGVFLLGACLEARPAAFTASGLRAALAPAALPPQPAWVSHLIHAALSTALAAPVLWNTVLIAALALAAAALVARPGSLLVAVAATAVLLPLWVVGQDIGGAFTGIATDPDSAVALAVVVWAAYSAARGLERPPLLARAVARPPAPGRPGTRSA